MHVGSIPTSHTNLSKGNIMQIKVQIRNVYGNISFYPMCDKARIFASIAGTKTLTSKALADVAALGIEVVLDDGSIKQQNAEALASINRLFANRV